MACNHVAFASEQKLAARSFQAMQEAGYHLSFRLLGLRRILPTRAEALQCQGSNCLLCYLGRTQNPKINMFHPLLLSTQETLHQTPRSLLRLTFRDIISGLHLDCPFFSGYKNACTMPYPSLKLAAYSLLETHPCTSRNQTRPFA